MLVTDVDESSQGNKGVAWEIGTIAPKYPDKTILIMPPDKLKPEANWRLWQSVAELEIGRAHV